MICIPPRSRKSGIRLQRTTQIIQIIHILQKDMIDPTCEHLYIIYTVLIYSVYIYKIRYILSCRKSFGLRPGPSFCARTCVSVYAPPLGHVVAGELWRQILLVGESRQRKPCEVDHSHGGHQAPCPFPSTSARPSQNDTVTHH